MPAGRPRTTTPEDHELKILGQELVDWATYADTEKPKKDDKRLHLKQWWALVKGFSKVQWDKMYEKPIFRAYYDKAQAAISIRYIDGTINPSISQRFLRLYFSDLKNQEDHDADREVERKKALDEKPPANTEINTEYEQILDDNESLKEQNKQLLEKLNELQNKIQNPVH